MSAHTPGPWVVVHDHPGKPSTRASIGYIRAAAHPAAFNEFAVVYGCETEQQAANARLIAAAPAMLEALEYIANDGLAGRSASAKLEDAITLARAAITKATGAQS